MKVTIQQTKEKDGWLLKGLTYVQVVIEFTNEEKFVIQNSGIERRIFFEPELHPEGTGNSLRQPVTVGELLKKKEHLFVPLGFDQIAFQNLEKDLEQACRQLKNTLTSLSEGGKKKELDL
jgi:hypothetical protein